MLRSSSDRRPGTSAGSATTGIGWPARSWRATCRVRHAVHRRQLRVLSGSARAGASRLSDRRNARRRLVASSPSTTGTGGLVSVGTVTAQLLYEIDRPAYINPDVVARFDTIQLEQQGPDRVRISGVRGEPAPPTIKVCLNYLGGFRNQMTFVLTGLDIEEKAALVERTLRRDLNVDAVRRVRDRPGPHRQARRRDEPGSRGPAEGDGQEPGRRRRWTAAFSSPIIEMALASYPGLFCTTPPTEASPFGVYWPTLVPADVPAARGRAGRRHADSRFRRRWPRATRCTIEAGRATLPPVPAGPTQSAPLGTLFAAPLGRQGGQCQRRRLGPRRGGLCLAGNRF